MAKKNPSEENVLEENLLEEDFNEEDFGEVVVEMTDDDGNSYFYTEQMIIPVGDDDFAILVEVTEHDHEHCEHHHEHHHEHEHEGCECGCGCEEGDVIIAKIVTDPETGEEADVRKSTTFNPTYYTYDGAADNHLMLWALQSSYIESITITPAGDTNGISQVNAQTRGNNKWYTLQGVEVAQPSNGIFVKNGRKVIVK